MTDRATVRATATEVAEWLESFREPVYGADSGVLEVIEGAHVAAKKLRAALLDAETGTGKVGNGNTFIFCDYVGDCGGCVRGAGHNGRHLMSPAYDTYDGPVVLAETGTDWQPIATAPKNGTRVLIWAESPATGHRSVHLAWWAIPYEDAPESAGWWETGLYGSHHPVVPQFTHGWMPLPAPPGAETGTAPEQLARRFHETYERLAPDYGYKTREASRKPWEDVPDQNKALMIAVCAEILGTAPEQEKP